MKTAAARTGFCAGLLALLLACPALAFRGDPKRDEARRAPEPPRAAAAVLQADQQAAAAQAAAAGLRIRWDAALGTPISVRGDDLSVPRAFSPPRAAAAPPASLEQAAAAVLGNLARLYRLRDPAAEFRTRAVEADALGFRHVRLDQVHAGLPVDGSQLIVHFDRGGRAYQVNGRYVPDIACDPAPALTAAQAAAAALADLAPLSGGAAAPAAGAELSVFVVGAAPRLAWRLTLLAPDAGNGPGRWRYWIDARDGSVLLRYNDVPKIAPPSGNGAHTQVGGAMLAGEGGGPTNVTGWLENNGTYYLYNKLRYWYVYNVAASGYTDNNTYAYRMTPNWGTSDRAEISTASGFDHVQRYYLQVHGRHSFNDANIYARANVHEGNRYVNAFWDGSDFHFGDGDGVAADCLAVLDICGHEYTHAVTEYTAGLIYSYESGALNESFSDIFGACVEFFAQPDGRAHYPAAPPGTADWLCGEDCWVESIALRDLRNPRNTLTVGAGNEQPSRYHGTYWYTGAGDNGGVHYNSGVQNFLFYLVAEGGSGDNDGILYNMTGIGIANAAQVAYRALTVYCIPSTDYAAARAAWASAAEDLNTNWVASVEAAWTAVGLGPFAVLPEGPVLFRGPEGGPFTPAEETYEVRNEGFAALAWDVSSAEAWLDVSPTGGVLAASSSVTVRVAPNAGAESLPNGVATNRLVFRDLSHGAALMRYQGLLVGMPDYFTELFDDASPNDLAGQMFTFTPTNSPDGYRVAREPVTEFPTDPAGARVLPLGDDSSVPADLAGGARVFLYGTGYSRLYIGSNGYLTFGGPDGSYSEGVGAHFSIARVAALFDDLDPTRGGTVTATQKTDRAVVTWDGVLEFGANGPNSFQIEMFFDGRIRIAFLELAATDGLVGLSRGTGVPLGFVKSDFSSYPLTQEPLPGFVQFAGTGADAPEGAGTVQLVVQRVNGASGPASVAYATSDATAVAGADYTACTGTLYWADGDASDRFIDVPIAGDALYEGAETFAVALSDAAGAGLGEPSLATVTIEDDDAAPMPAVRLNAGGAATGGWSADYGSSRGGTRFTLDPVAGVPPGLPMWLYQTERNGTSFSYNFPWIRDGACRVRLHFAEIVYRLPGKRRFHVDIEGQRVLSSYDIVADVGPDQAVVKEFDVAVAGGDGLQIRFTGVLDKAKISAIETVPPGSGLANLLTPDNGGVLESFTSQYRTTTGRAAGLTDGLPQGPAGGEWLWASKLLPAPPQEFVWSFASGKTASLSGVVFYNYGQAALNRYSREFSLDTSPDGAVFTPVLIGTLPASPQPVFYELPAGTDARFLRLQVLSGYEGLVWEMAEFEAWGSLTSAAAPAAGGEAAPCVAAQEAAAPAAATQAAQASAPAARAGATDTEAPVWPKVWTSGDLAPEFAGRYAADGDTNTLWVGNAGGAPWTLTMDLGAARTLAGADLLFGDAAWPAVWRVGSSNAVAWFALDNLTNGPLPCRYLYFTFGDDGTGAGAPALREIELQSE